MILRSHFHCSYFFFMAKHQKYYSQDITMAAVYYYYSRHGGLFILTETRSGLLILITLHTVSPVWSSVTFCKNTWKTTELLTTRQDIFGNKDKQEFQRFFLCRCVKIICSYNCRKKSFGCKSVANPGVPRRNANPKGGEGNLLLDQFFFRNCMNMNYYWPRGGVPLDQPTVWPTSIVEYRCTT